MIKEITTILFVFGILFAGTSILANDELLFELELSTMETIEGTGTHFEIINSEYLNITIDSEKEINLVLESIPKIISLNIESVDINTTSTNIILSGLEPVKTYYKYQDSHKNMVVFVSNNEGIIYFEQDLSFSHHTWFQEQESTVFLPEDCDDYGIWDEDILTCTLTQNLTESVEITENDIIWITKKYVKNILVTRLKVAQRLELLKEKGLERFDKLIEKAKNPRIEERLQKAKDRYEKRMDKRIVKILESFIRKVEFYTQRGYITGQGSEFLIDDAQYIIEHL